MKGDILKKFVDENRDDFDDQSPDADILGRIQSRLGIEPSAKVPKPGKLIRLRYWWAAAAVVAAILCGGILVQHNSTADLGLAHTKNEGVSHPVAPTHRNNTELLSDPEAASAAAEPSKTREQKLLVPATAPPRLNAGKDDETRPRSPAPATDSWQPALQNESASVRLAAVLASDKNAHLSDKDLNLLFYTMNNDENSNVRLAALDVLKRRAKATNLLLQSVDKQDDPVVQMELLASLSPAEAVKVEQQLLDITQNPLTIDAVRNEAYAVLLRSNTNF